MPRTPSTASASSSSTGPARAYRLKVTLLDTKPPIWRRLDVPADVSLATLHRILQLAMGWTDSHLHQFDKDGVGYGPDDPELELDLISERTTPLEALLLEPGDRMDYLYDFGDDWRHRIVLEAITPAGPRVARVVAARRACPPEDVGGVWGFEEFLEAMANPADARHGELREWHGGDFAPADVDVDGINQQLMRVKLRPVARTLGARRGRGRQPSGGEALGMIVDRFMRPATAADPVVMKSLNRKLADPAAILTDREVEFLVTHIQHAIGGLGRVPTRVAAAAEDHVRWQAVRAMCARAREARGLTTKDAAKLLKVARYRVEAIERGPGPSFDTAVAVRYVQFLRLEAWIARWARANRELARRTGLG